MSRGGRGGQMGIVEASFSLLRECFLGREQDGDVGVLDVASRVMSTMFHKSVESIHSSNHSGVLFCGIVTREQENTVCRGAAVFRDARSSWQGGVEELPEDVTHRIVLSTVFSSGASKHTGGRDMVHPSGRHPAIPDQLEVGNHGARHEQRAAQRLPCTKTTSSDPRRRVEAPLF